MTTPKRPLPLRFALAAVVVTLVLGGCGGTAPGKDDAMQPTLTRAQATERIKSYIKQTVAELPQTAKLDLIGYVDSLPCGGDDWLAEETDGRVRVEYTYSIKGLTIADYPKHFDTVERYWESRGYRQRRFDKNGLSVQMIHTDPDGFRLDLTTNGDGTALSIQVQSPCIWPDGTPAPQSS